MTWKDIFDILYEDNHLIAVNKKGGVLVQGDETGDKPLSEYVKDYLREKYQKPGNIFAGVIHRLDRPVSGLVLLAKTSKALERMNEQFREKQIRKKYLAVVSAKPQEPEATLVQWLAKDHKRNISVAYNSDKKGGVRAELSYSLLSVINEDILLEVLPVTGRPHQIRVQLASIGCPIKGDVKYGSKESAHEKTIALHAYSLEFTHPVKKEPVRITARIPQNRFWDKFRNLI